MGKNERQILKSVIGDGRACSDMSTGMVTMRERRDCVHTEERSGRVRAKGGKIWRLQIKIEEIPQRDDYDSERILSMD